ncbi:Vacuolar sorting protein 39 [Entamoeba marina]
MAKRESDPVEVIKIEKPTETISSLGASTCSCKLQNDILLFGKKGLMMAVTIDKGELNVIHQISISGNIDQMWYQPQMKLLICIINKKLESFVLDLNKKASAEVFKRITSKQIKNVGPFECFSPFVKKGIVYIAAVDNRKKSGITIIESKPDGIFYTETKVWNADDKIVGCCFVNQHLVLVYQTKIQIITFFGKSDVITEKSINPFKGKPRFLPLQTYQILVHTGTCVYLIDETTINLIPNDYPVITISEMSPFVFFMQEFAQNKFYITYRLEPMTHSSTPSREFRRPEYIKGSFMHDSFPVFISSSYKQLIYFTPNPKWYETAIQNGHYQSAIEFITMLGNNSNENSEKFKQCAYTLGVINKVIEFYNDESNRTFQSIVTILNDFKMGNVSPKNVLIFLVLFIFQDYLPELFIHFKDWFPVSLENWKKDIVKSFPSGLVKNLQDSIDDLLRKRSSLLGEDNALTLVHHFNAQGHTVGDVIQQIITYLFAVKSQMTTTSDTTEVCENKTLFFTSFLVIVYFHSPNCKEMFDLLKMTKYLQKAVVLDMLKEQTTTNTKLLVEYYINQNHIDGVFNTPGIEYYDKRNATMRILSNTEITDNTKVTDKIMLLICEKLSLIGVQFTNQINEKISDELYLIFGKDKSRFSVTSVCDVIEHWDLSPLALHPSESTELRYRLSALYSDVRLGTTSDPAIAQVYINKVIKYLEIASQTNVLPYGGFVERFIDTIDQFPSLASAIKLEEVNCKAYKPRAAIGKLRGMDLLNLLLETVVELQKDEESLELIYDTAIESLVKFMTTLYNQKKFIQSVSSESVLQLLYSEEIRNIVKREYYPLRSVDNLFAEISLLIFTSDAPLETYFRFHNVLIEKMLPGLTLRFIWDIADPTMFPVAEDDNTIKRELKLFKESNGIKSILEGVICYLEKKKKLEGTLLTDCYLQYLSLQGIDRLDVTSQTYGTND